MPYVNPIPAIDTGKQFEIRLEMRFDMLTPVDKAKRRAAEYILAQTPETLAKWLQCTNVKALYPKDLTPDERAYIGSGCTLPNGNYPNLTKDNEQED